MKIVRTLDVGAEEFFDALVARLRAEIADAAATPEAPTPSPEAVEVAAGTVWFARDAAGTPSIRTRVAKLERPRRLVIEARDGRERSRTEYRLEPVAAEGDVPERVCVTFEQNATTLERSLAAKGAIRRGMAELSYLRRMLNGLYAVERDAQDIRRGEEPRSYRTRQQLQQRKLRKGARNGRS